MFKSGKFCSELGNLVQKWEVDSCIQKWKVLLRSGKLCSEKGSCVQKWEVLHIRNAHVPPGLPHYINFHAHVI